MMGNKKKIIWSIPPTVSKPSEYSDAGRTFCSQSYLSAPTALNSFQITRWLPDVIQPKNEDPSCNVIDILMLTMLEPSAVEDREQVCIITLLYVFAGPKHIQMEAHMHVHKCGNLH